MKSLLTHRVSAIAAVIVVVLGAGTAVASAGASKPPKPPKLAAIYDSTPSPLPPNLFSDGPEAYAFNEIGNEVNLSNPDSRALTNVVVTMSSWACETGTWESGCTTTPGSTYPVDITFKIYQPGATPGTVGDVIGTRTQPFNIPFRPSSGGCPDPTKWLDSATGACSHGLANNITFDFSSLNLTLPSTVVFGISYNTKNYGPSPTGSSNPEDSLNVGLTTSSTIATKNPSVGADTDPGNLFINSGQATNPQLFCSTTTAMEFVETFVWCDTAEGAVGPNGRVTGASDIPAVRFNVTT